MPRRAPAAFTTLRGHVGVAVLLLTVVGGLARADEDYTSEELIAALTEQITSIDTLYCEYTRAYGTSPAKNLRYARAGRKWHLTEYRTVADVVEENGTSSDGHKVYAYVRTRGPKGDRWGQLEIQDYRDCADVTPDWFLGTKLSSVCRSAFGAMVSAESTTVSDSSSTGRRVFRLDATRIPHGCASSDSTQYDASLLLDPVHGLLAREILILRTGDDEHIAEWKHHWTISQFREVPDHRKNGEPRWFPVDAMCDQGKVAPPIRIHVSKIQINAALDESLFSPRVPDGTLLADTTSDGARGLGVKGDNKAVDQRMAQLLAEKEIDPPSFPQWSWTVAAVAIVVLCSWLWLRSRP